MATMFVSQMEKQEFDDERLARMSPEAYEVKMKVVMTHDLFWEIISFFKKLFTKWTKEN